MTLQTERLLTIEQFRAFVEGSEAVDYKPKDRAAAYDLVRRTLARFDCHRLGRADRGCVRAYIGKVCGFSTVQTTRLIRQQEVHGRQREAGGDGPSGSVAAPGLRQRRGLSTSKVRAPIVPKNATSNEPDGQRGAANCRLAAAPAGRHA